MSRDRIKGENFFWTNLCYTNLAQFLGKCDEKNEKNRENSGQAQMHPTAITVMKNFKKKREEKKTALIRISDIFTE